MKGKVKANTGRRYTEAERKRVLEFVASQGRGGVTAAQKKFGVSYVALRRWMNGEMGANLASRKTAPTSKVLASVLQRAKEIEKFQKALKKFLAKI